MLDMPLTKPKELYNVFDKLGELKSMWHMIRLFGKYGKTTGEEFAGRFKNPVLREAILSISQSDSIDSDSMNGIVGALFSLATKGYGFPEGGSLELARSIERRYAGLGGQIHYGARVKKILVEGGKAAGVLLENGATATADIVISAADGYSTIFRMLGGRYVDRRYRSGPCLHPDGHRR